MRLRPGFLLPLWGALLLAPIAACAQTPPDEAIRAGRYEEAIRGWEDALEDEPSNDAIRRSLVTALIDVGRYDDAIENAGPLHNLRGEAHRALGQLGEAEAAFQEAIATGGADRWTAEFNLAELLFLRGERDEAIRRFDRFIDLYNQGGNLTAAELTAVGNAVWYLGIDEPALFQDAVLAFDEATKLDPSYMDAHVRIAELFVEKYNSPEAHTALQEALALNPSHPRALLALAKAHAFDGNRGEALERVQQALETNPNLVPGRVFLARMYLDVEDGEAAQEELDRALEVNPGSLDALSMQAALYFITDQQPRYEEVKRRVAQLAPRYAGLLTTVAEIAAQGRRYADAERLAREATTVDQQAWSAWGAHGLNLFRLGRIDAARTSLEAAFAGDPYNVWIKNNLDLLDTFEEYDVVQHPGFEFMLHRDESELLDAYLRIAAIEAYQTLAERYGVEPSDRVRVELYPRSADFSVRTVGLAGLGALGVSFGDVVALDSPSAREAGRYNWLTTLWHEIAHTIALSLSNSRVPRWFTEGLSVYEERQAEPSWPNPVTPEILIFYDDDELPPVSRLNEGFIRPSSPRHLAAAYEVASFVIEWIVETEGHDAIIEILRAYGAGRTDEEIFRSVLGLAPEEVDEEFDRWLRERADPDDARAFMSLYTEAQQRLAEGNFALARAALEGAAQLFPVAQSGSPYAQLARLSLDAGDEAAAIESLRRVSEFDETAYRPNLDLARLLEQSGDIEGAAEALERAVWIYPYEPAPHVRLAELYGRLEDWPRAVRERRAVVALTPTDRAEALYQLAVALRNAGDRAGARIEVLRALEIAPGYQEAQELLLQLHEAT